MSGRLDFARSQGTFKVSVEGLDELVKISDNFRVQRIQAAARMATNDSLKWGRTQIRRSIQEYYNIKAKRVNDSVAQRGLKIVLARDADLNGKITAGHKPIDLSDITKVKISQQVVAQNVTYSSSVATKRVKARKGAQIKRPVGVDVQISKGRKETIQRAFFIAKFGKTVFARGTYGQNGMEFTDDPRAKIQAIKTVSVATAALNTRAMAQWSRPIQDRFDMENRRQISRLLGTSSSS